MDASRMLCFVAVMLPMAMAAPRLTASNTHTAAAAEQSMRQFLAQGDEPHAYRATRRLEARHRQNVGWIEAVTEYSPATGFSYRITAEGGSDQLRDKVLRKILEGEREAVAKGEIGRATLAPCNYEFQPAGVDDAGLAAVLLSPRRKEHMLVDGTMFLRPVDGELVRVQGRLAKSPSFWVKSVDIVRSYDRINGAVVPVALDTTAQVRMFGTATLRMTYDYDEIDGQPVGRQLTARR
jgi:hypothetical protein